jgi:predicted RNase H-like HicB family nuclease
MLIKVGIENNYENRSLAYVLDFPGCFAYGSSETEALVRVPQALLAYKSWLDGYTDESWLQDLADFDIRLTEVYECHSLNDQYEPAAAGMEVNAWFHHDWLPLSEKEIHKGLLVLTWAHQDLYELTTALLPWQLERTYPGERWSIRGILYHVANAELYYLGRLALTPYGSQDLSQDAWLALQFTLQQNIDCDAHSGRQKPRTGPGRRILVAA